MDLSNLLQNKLFLQYLSQAGQGMASGEGVAPGLNQVTQQNIQAQNFMQLLREFLGPSGSKMTADSKGMRIDLPADQAQGFFQVDPNLAIQTSPESQPAQQAGGTQPMANPFGQASSEGFGGIGDIDPSMLAGLTPEHLTAIMGLKMKQEEFGRQSVKDAQDALYKDALIREADARISKMGKDEKTAAMKNYEYAINQGYTGSFAEWEKDARTTNQKDYDAAVQGGYRGSFHKWLSGIKRSERAPALTELAMDAARQGPESLEYRALDLIGKVNAGERLTPSEERRRSVDIARIDKMLTNNPGSKTNFGFVGTYNSLAPDDGMHYYVIEGTVMGYFPRAKKKALPIIDGRQLTMGDVRQRAQQEGITAEQMIQMIDAGALGAKPAEVETQPEVSYQSAEEVRAAYNERKLTREQAINILVDKFGYKGE